MAVEIPIFVDVDKAFKDAASRIPSAIKPMQEYLDKNTLSLRFDIDGKKNYLKDILVDSTLSANQLKQVLGQINAWIDSRASAGGFDLLKGMTASEKIHLQALGALEHKINGVSDASKLMERIYTANITKVKNNISALNASIDDLTRKQNKYNALSKKNTPGARLNYSNVTKKITAAQSQVLEAKRLLASLTVELDKISIGATRAAASIGAIKTPAVQMAEEFRRGSAYVEKWNAGLGAANSRIGALIKSSLSLIALHSATRFVRNIREVTAEFEMQRVALGSLIHDTERAEQLFRQLKAAAIKSPFEIKDLVTYTKQLSAYQIETDKLYETTMRLADISAGLGVDMGRLILAFGQVRAASVLRGQELRQFTEAGIPLIDKLAEKFTELNNRTVTTAEVFDLISKRAVPFKMIEEIFEEMTSAGGDFYKMQEKQSETLKGQWMKLKDALSIMYDEIGNTSVVHGAMESLLQDAMNLLQNWRDVGRTLGVVIASFTAYKVALINARIAANALTLREAASISAIELNVVGRSKLIATLFGETAATKAQIAVGNVYVKMKKREMLATNLFTKSLYKMIAALLSNPYALFIAGATALVAVLVKLSKSAQDATITVDEFRKSIDSFASSQEHLDGIKDLIEKYDTLSSTSNRTKEEQEQLNRVTRELAKTYPSAVSGVNEFGDAVSINTEKIRAMTEEEERAIRTLLEGQKARAEASLSQLIERREEINKILKEGGQVELGGTEEFPELSFVKLSEKDLEGYGKEILDIIAKINELSSVIDEANTKLAGLGQGSSTDKKAESQLSGWRKQVVELQASMLKVGQTPLFTEKDIQDMSSVYDLSKKLKKETEDLESSISGMSNALSSMVSGDAKNALQKEKEDAEATLAIAKAITALFGFNFTKRGSGSQKTDPFITQMQNRIKFMQDFKKGYDDLSKYMARSGALEKESEIMLGRGTSLGLSADDQKRAAEDLSKWYEEMIDVVSSRLRSKGVSGASVTDLLSIDTTKQSKTIQDLQKLLQQLWDAKTDFDTTTFKKNIEDELKRVSDEIKRSETARDFYKNILDLTGDEELAATMGISVYGGIGAEFKDRMQAQLNKALSTLDAGALTEELRTAVAGQDFDVILKNLDKFPEEWQKRLKEMAADSQKFEADRIAGLFKALQNAKTYGEKRVELAKQTAKRTAEIESLNIPQANKDSLLAQNTRKEAEEAAKLQYEAFKDTPMYVELFADLDAASSRMLRNMQGQLESMKENWKDLHPRELKELQSRLSEIYQQLALRNPFKALIDSIKEYNSLRKTMGRREAENVSIEADERVRKEKDKLNAYTQEFELASKLYKKDDERYKMAKSKMEAQQKIVDASIEEAEAAQNTANQYRAVKQQILEAGEGLMKWKGYLDDSLSAIGDIVDTFGSSDTSEMFDIISGGISKTVGGAANLAMGIGSGNPVQILQGISGIVTGIAKTVQDIKIKKIDKDIEHQQHLLEELEYSYGRLEKTMEKSFGSDYIYNYNKQLETLVAKQAAYEEQARLEREKGKKADEDKIRDYENSARDVADQIMDMRSQLSEFFTGTDLSSAAQDFADAWIEAYKEFSSTTDAMSEKFNDMIQNMISRSLAAKVMQEMLQPIFDQIDTLSKDGLLSTEDIAEVAALAQERIPMINEAMTNLMTSLAAAGYDVKTQTAGLSGISKGYATASEESILGLAAAVNTQNFYISYVPTISENVAQILAAMTGGVSATSPALTNENGDVIPSVQQMVYDHLPNMDQNLSEMLRLFRSVVTTKNASTNTAYVAVK